MEYYKKFFYVVRFNKEGGKKNNNCVEIYDRNGKRKKIYTIRDPKTNVTMADLKSPKKSRILKSDMKEERWEIETFSHYKGNTFYYTQFKPKRENNKQAYLYKINLKAKTKSKDKKKTKTKKKSSSKKKAKTKKKTKK